MSKVDFRNKVKPFSVFIIVAKKCILIIIPTTYMPFKFHQSKSYCCQVTWSLISATELLMFYMQLQV